LLFKNKLTINRSVGSKTVVVATPFVLTSTGVVLLLLQPNAAESDVNNKVVIPPVVYFDTV
jgi:hypothetical protein